MKDFFSKLAGSEQGSLTETELDMVAGGKSNDGIIMTVGSVITLGTSCAIISAVIIRNTKNKKPCD